MDQAIHNQVASLLRGIGANRGEYSHFIPYSRALSANANKIESLR
jgi:hypothetical protein